MLSKVNCLLKQTKQSVLPGNQISLPISVTLQVRQFDSFYKIILTAEKFTSYLFKLINHHMSAKTG